MNKTVIVFGIIIFVIIFWLIGFVNTLHDDVDVSYGFNEKAIVTGDVSYITSSKLSLKEKKSLWNKSNLKQEMLEFFPHFIQMKNFVEENMEDDDILKKELLSNIEFVEIEYIGGSFSIEKARTALSNF